MAGTEWPCTAEEIVHQRDELAQSWKEVAVALDLGLGKKNRGRYAQHAYEDLTGRSRHDSRPLGGRRPASVKTNGEGVTVPKRRTVSWDDDTDQGEIEEALKGVRHENEKGEISWSPVKVYVRHNTFGHEWQEEMPVRYATAFTYGPEGDQPLQVTMVENDAGASRTVFVADVVKVVR